MQKILVSACLLGRPVRYDGRAKAVHHRLLQHWQAEGRLVPLCPEVAAGLPTPRPPAEIAPGRDGGDVLAQHGRILESRGRDVSEAFRRGAQIALETAQTQSCRFALLTDGSPSCGSRFIHSGAFDGMRRPGQGVVAALLRQHGIGVFAEDQIERLAEALESPACGLRPHPPTP